MYIIILIRINAVGMKRWLSSLKTIHLLHISRITGVPQRGPKPCLARRIERAILQCQLPGVYLDTRNNGVHNNTRANADDTRMSILSVDMGVQNLGIAHFEVLSSSNDVVNNNVKPILDAWYRIRVSDIDVSNDANVGLDLDSTFCQEGERSKKAAEETTQQDDTAAKNKKKKGQRKKDTLPFTAPAYAARAYRVLNSLLEKHQPTHVLIERQRFRSGGSAAVQEWTLRVGMFEAMLHATLHTYRKRELLRLSESHDDAKPPVVAPLVFAVEPQRIVKYWRLVMGSSVFEEGTKDALGGRPSPEKLSPADVKKAHVNLVAKWLLDLADGDDKANDAHMRVSGNKEMREMVHAYLDRHRGIKKTEAKSVDKLDDLADCVLQGVAWWEWQVNKYRIARDGLDLDGELEV